MILSISQSYDFHSVFYQNMYEDMEQFDLMQEFKKIEQSMAYSLDFLLKQHTLVLIKLLLTIELAEILNTIFTLNIQLKNYIFLMLTELQNKLQYLENKRQKHNELINQLYSNFQIIFTKKQHLNEPFKPKNNLFLKVRVEVLCQIYAFLDPFFVLSLRLVDKQTNYQIIQTFPILIYEFQKRIIFLEIEKEKLELNEEQYQIFQELEKQRIEANQIISSITNRDLINLITLNVLPSGSIEVAHLLVTLFYPNFDEKKQDIWGTCKSLFKNKNFKQLFINYDIAEISEQLLEKLQLIHQYDGGKIYSWSHTLFNIFNYLKLIVESRETTIYKNKNSQFVIEQNIIKIQDVINCFTKIMKKNQLEI